MVAYTSPDCLPYFECGDPVCLNTGTVCDPSTVWCDFAAAVEAKLDEFDAVASRTAFTVPMVWMDRSTPFVTTVGVGITNPVVFDSVVVDTDNMASLDVNNNGFSIMTSGLYQIVAYAIGQTDTAGSGISAALNLIFSPFNATYTPVNVSSLTAISTVQVDDVILTPQIQMVLPLVVGQLVSVTIDVSGVNPNTVTFSQIMVSATWMADVP